MDRRTSILERRKRVKQTEQPLSLSHQKNRPFLEGNSLIFRLAYVVGNRYWASCRREFDQTHISVLRLGPYMAERAPAEFPASSGKEKSEVNLSK